MKQILTILLLFFYSFSSIGATVKAHLCGRKVQKCFCGKSNKKDSCCAEKKAFVKKQDLHHSSELPAFKKFFTVATLPGYFHPPLIAPILVRKAKGNMHSKKGLLFTGPPIYALDCLYLI